MALISVTEYSKKTGKDPGTIRKHLISGRLPGFKIGNQWVIEENQPFTEDRRIRSGKYVGWRKTGKTVSATKPANVKKKDKLSIISNDPEILGVVKSTVEFAKNVLGEYLNTIILYGQCISKEKVDNPDIEIALMLSNGYSLAAYDELLDFASMEEIEHGMILSIKCIEMEKYEELKNTIPLYKIIQNEGIIIWER